MRKSATLNLRVDPEVKEQAEAVLEKLVVPMSTAVDIFLRQVSLTGGIPFYVKL
ncbi:MAG: type II toxin-antitoxin system RelB/DinJ family antitoxin, partial [Phascolarctobacterium sp.]|nr:type II toxin-antitoxin system RelB/DinJ family antitoxin [Phascolarctobacterium sp.]